MLSALNLQHQSQVNIKYGENFNSETYTLLEVDEGLLHELLGNRLCIKGNLDEEAVLCTTTATYAMKFVSTSNTVLLVSPKELRYSTSDANCEDATVTDLKASAESDTSVVATAAGHVELVEISPKLEPVKDLLSQRPYKEDVDGDTVVEEEDGLYTWYDLLNRVQASESQLRTALKTLEAVEIGKYWRILDSDFMHGLLEVLILTATQYDWPLDALPGLDVVRTLKTLNYSPQIVMHCLDTYGIKTGSELRETQDNGSAKLTGLSTSWAMDENKVCLHYARKLLATNPRWKLETFLDAWQKESPSGMNSHLGMLKGEVLVDMVGPESWLHHFSINLLPRKPEARFAALFKRRPKWMWEDLEPYLRDMKEPNQSVEAMLLKYTRKTHPTSDSTPMYTARR